MAFKKGVNPKTGKPSAPAAKKPEGKPIVTFLPKVLHSRVRLGCIALGTNVSSVIRELLEEWCKDNQKAIAAVVNQGMSESDEEETEDVEDEDESEDEDEDEDEE